jgi:hypothetical protein
MWAVDLVDAGPLDRLSLDVLSIRVVFLCVFYSERHLTRANLSVDYGGQRIGRKTCSSLFSSSLIIVYTKDVVGSCSLSLCTELKEQKDAHAMRPCHRSLEDPGRDQKREFGRRAKDDRPSQSPIHAAIMLTFDCLTTSRYLSSTHQND